MADITEGLSDGWAQYIHFTTAMLVTLLLAFWINPFIAAGIVAGGGLVKELWESVGAPWEPIQPWSGPLGGLRDWMFICFGVAGAMIVILLVILI